VTGPYERLAAEQIPTGTFGHALPPRPAQPHERPAPHWSPTQQAQHRADLLSGIDGWVWDDDVRDDERRHLQLITNQTTTDAA
jgi:hypothetical protein